MGFKFGLEDAVSNGCLVLDERNTEVIMDGRDNGRDIKFYSNNIHKSP